ncbi:hypothetical protein SD81_005650 [Tolypothrix campylonemoides VB511288]|nr:hypothetical protein SD81_005650 [Tolypothrix campylonemoides VB511288]
MNTVACAGKPSCSAVSPRLPLSPPLPSSSQSPVPSPQSPVPSPQSPVPSPQSPVASPQPPNESRKPGQR